MKCGDRKLRYIFMKQKKIFPEVKKESLCKNVQFISVLKKKKPDFLLLQLIY